MKKNKTILYILIIFTLVFCSCQLAKEDTTNSTNDRLIGVLVTTEYLDLFDFDSYFNDNINKLVRGKNTIDNSSKYQGRIYATLQEVVFTSEETGEKTAIEEYVFDSVEGIEYFSARYTRNGDSYGSSNSDEGLSDGHMGLFYGDNEERIELEGTIYVSTNLVDQVYYFNPVYQAEDGSVYATSGSGFSSNGFESEGAVYSQTLTESTSVNENGKETKCSTSVKISIATMYEPKEIVILQMDKNSYIIDRISLTPDSSLTEVEVLEKTDYLIVETHKTDIEGKDIITRELFSKTSENISFFSSREDGILVKKWIQLI